MSLVEQIVTFQLGRSTFGIEVTSVQEVMRSVEITPVPRASEEVQGLINLRGQIIPAINLARRLRLPHQEIGGSSMNVVVRHSDFAASLLVDDVGDALEIEETEIAETPKTLSSHLQSLVSRVVKRSNGVILLLSLEALLDFECEEYVQS